MSGHPLLTIRSLFSILFASLLLIAVACGGTATAPEVVQEEVVKEVVVEKEAAAEVPQSAVTEEGAIKEAEQPAAVVAEPEPAEQPAAKVELDRLVIAIPLPGGGSDTNITWVTSRGGTLDVRPALEHLLRKRPNHRRLRTPTRGKLGVEPRLQYLDSESSPGCTVPLRLWRVYRQRPAPLFVPDYPR